MKSAPSYAGANQLAGWHLKDFNEYFVTDERLFVLHYRQLCISQQVGASSDTSRLQTVAVAKLLHILWLLCLVIALQLG